MKYARIAAEVFNTPVLMEPNKLETIVSVLNSRLVGHELRDVSDRERLQAGYEVVKGVGIIAVMGSLVHRGSWLGSYSGLTGYDFLSNALQTALEDDAVERIALVVDTPGGQANGAFDFADQIYDARNVKHITAIVADSAYSAGYLIASAANEVVVTRTGGVGSVGVVIAHADYSKMDEKDGLKVTYIHSGAHKVDGNPHEPLSDSAKGRLQAESDQLYQLFVETVARNRAMTVEAVKNTEALTYTGKKGIDIGFADRISTEEKELSRLFGQTGASHNTQLNEEFSMSDDTGAGELTAGDIQSQLQEAENKGYARGFEEGIDAEMTRVNAIFEAGEGKADLAMNLVMNGVPQEQALNVLQAAPIEAKPNTSALDAAMAGTDPNITDDVEDTDTVDAVALSIVNAGA